jgi:hypothetical protein
VTVESGSQDSRATRFQNGVSATVSISHCGAGQRFTPVSSVWGKQETHVRPKIGFDRQFFCSIEDFENRIQHFSTPEPD